MLGRSLRWIQTFITPGARSVLIGVLVISSSAILLPKLSEAALDTPQILSYQGRLTDAQKVTVADGSRAMAFVIYDASVAGNCEWTAAGTCGAETTVSVTVSDGIFNVLLGASPQVAFPDPLFNTTEERWLEIRIDGETLTPRRRIVSSATALQAGNASLLDSFNTSQTGGSSAFIPVTDSAGALRLGSVAGPADPSGANGTVVYNTALGKFRCFEGGSWTDCVAAAGSAGGWTDFGAYVNLITPSDNVGIGIAGAPTAKLEVNGAVRMYGGQMDLNTTGTGVTNIGSGSSTGAVLIGNVGNTVTFGTSILSQTTNLFDLGSDTQNFKRLFIGETGIIFEGGVDNAFETTFNVGNPTADRAINLPDASGDVLLDSNTNIFNVTATSGTSQPIGFGDTITIAAGANLTATAGATDTVTLAVVGSPTFTSVISPSYTGTGAVAITSGATNSLTLDTSSASGSVLIGNTNAGALTIGRATVVTTVNGTLTANTFTSSGATLSGGTVNGMVIGGVTPAASTFTTLLTTGNATIGDATTDRMTLLGELVLGSISANPTGANGMMIYNSTDNKFRCFENGVWLDCVSGASSGGWTDDGTIVRLATGTDQVRINTSAAGNGHPLEVNGIVRSITGGFQFPDGSIMTTAAATASGVSSITDINIESNTDNSGGGDVIISTSTAERMRINSVGNVGIGTSGPGAKLDVAGSFTANGSINLNQNSNNPLAICTGDSCNSTVTIGNTNTGDGGTPTVAISTVGWGIDTVGNASGFGTIGADGLVTFTAGMNLSGGTANINQNSNFATNICTGDSCNGAVSIGNNNTGDGNTPLVNITSAGNWSITNTGTIATTSTITSSGLITGNNGLTINTGAVNLLTTGTNAINVGSNTTFNGTVSIGNNDAGDGSNSLVNITSGANWSITNGGTFATLGTITSSGLITGNNGLTINTGAVNLLPTGTAAMNIGSNGSYNGAITIGNTDGGDGGTPTVAISSPGWSIDAAGNTSGFGTIGTDGRITSAGGLTVSGQTVELNRNSNFNVQICDMGGCNGTVSIGNNDGGDGGTPLVNITSAGNWSITNGGTFSTVGTITSSGLITGNNGLTINTGAVNLLPTGTAAMNIGSNGSYNGAITIGNTDGGDGGTPTVAISSPGWSIDAAGNTSGFGTIGTDGRITSAGGLTVSGQTVELNRSSNFNVHICDLGPCNGTISIGNTDGGDGGTPTIVITAPEMSLTGDAQWSITTGGAISTSGTITGGGSLDVTAGFVRLRGAGETTGIRLGTNTSFDDAIVIGNSDTGSGGSPALTIDTVGWSVSSTGNMSGIGSIGADGLITGTAGLTISGAAINLNVNTNAAYNLCTGDSCDGILTIGNTVTGSGGTPTVNIAAGDVSITGDAQWSISAAGAFTSSGNLSVTGGASISNGTINLNENTNNAVNICTGDSCDGVLTIGNALTGSGGTPTLTLTGGTAWSIGSTGTFSNSAGATITSSGRITGNGGLTIAGNTVLINENTNSAVGICTGDSCDTTVTIGNTATGSGGSPTVNIAAGDVSITGDAQWSISAAGAFTSSGNLSVTGGASISNGTINLNQNTNNAVNICTGDSCDTTITIGNTLSGSGGTPTVNINSGDISLTGDAQWSITAAGVFTSAIPASAFTERLCWSGSGSSTIADCTGTPGDYAEMYGTSDRRVEAGDLVMMDSARGAREVADEQGVMTSTAYVLKADVSNSALLFGIVSTAANETIGQAIPFEDNPRPIALSGRVPAKVNLENGPIAIGDPITASSVPGFGMKATQNGMIVGYALSAFTGADGESSGKVIVAVHTGWWNGSSVVAANSASGIAPTTTSTLHITSDTDYAMYSIFNIRAIRGMNWSISEGGEFRGSSLAVSKIVMRKTDGAATIGEGVIRAGEVSVGVVNASMKPTSKVFLSWRGNPGSFAVVSARAEGSFALQLAAPAIADAEFDYWIVEVEGAEQSFAPIPPPPAETTELTEPATTTELTETATTTEWTEPAEIVVEEPAPVIIAPAEPAPEPVLEPIPETVPEPVPENAPETTEIPSETTPE